MDKPEKAPTCPTCKAVLDCVSPLMKEEAQPKEGDFSVCFNCGEFLVFLEPPKVRLMEFMEEVTADDNILMAMKGIRQKVLKKKFYKDQWKEKHGL